MIAGNIRRINKGALVAIFDLEIPGWHLLFNDCKWFRKEDNEWVGLPSTSFTNREGKTVYKDLVVFEDKDVGKRFQAAALAAIRQAS